VRKEFSSLVCGSNLESAARLIYWLDRVYRPERFPGVWIEHGHQYDHVNRFFIKDVACWSADCPPIREDQWGTERLHECAGTRFLIKYMNDLDMDYPYVDNVKPFWRFLQLFGASAPDAPLSALVAIGQMTGYLSRTLVTRPKDVLSAKVSEPISAADAVLKAFRRSIPTRQKAFVQAIRDRKFPHSPDPEMALKNDASAAPLLAFLAENLDLLKMIDSRQGGTLNLLQSFFANETDDLREEAFKIANNPASGARTVVMGHTHEVVSTPQYINTGSWTRYYKLAKGEHLHPWSVLEKSGWKEFPCELNYALARGGSTPGAQMENHFRGEVPARA
jgi:hypothetical protein